MRIVTAYVAVGGNIDEEIHIPSALQAIMAYVDVVDVSTHYRTSPLNGRASQKPYLNGVWRIETPMIPARLIALLKDIENREGRIRSDDRFAPRTLDLDLVLYENLVDERLGIPDIDVLSRSFVFKPLLELDYHLIWPPTGRPLSDEVDLGRAESLEPNPEITGILKSLLKRKL